MSRRGDRMGLPRRRWRDRFDGLVCAGVGLFAVGVLAGVAIGKLVYG